MTTDPRPQGPTVPEPSGARGEPEETAPLPGVWMAEEDRRRHQAGPAGSSWTPPYGGPAVEAPPTGSPQHPSPAPHGEPPFGRGGYASQLPPGGYPPHGPRDTLVLGGPSHFAGPPPRGRLAGWVWAVIVMLALLLGLGGGLLGAAAYETWSGDEGGRNGDGLAGVETREDAPLPVQNGSIAAVAQELLPSTVQIIAALGGQSDGASGSGFVLDTEGHIVTNNHVVEGASDAGEVVVVDDEGNRYDAEIVGRSPVYDLAVLSAPDASRLRPAALGASEALHIGDDVVAIGSPLGLSSTVTAGIVSALDRPVTTGDSSDETSYINAVQTDAAINPGNSGGPLVNLAGEVVGVNSAIATTGGAIGGDSGNIGVGFAIPVEQVRTTADQILRSGEARYPIIGAKVATGGPVDAAGAEISEVTADGPAEDAGLRKGDVVVAVGEKRVTDGIALIVMIRTHQPGETVEFTVERDGDPRTVELTLDSDVG